jgi:NAD(P)H dehydrogenase (quinone)
MSIHNQQTVLVIGATGNIGSALVRELLTDPGPDNVKVRAIVRRPEAAESLRRLGVEAAFLDLAEIERLPLARNKPLLDALAGVDRLFLLTGYTVQMLAQSKAVIDAAKLAGVRHIVDLSAWATNDTTSAHHGWYQFVERTSSGPASDSPICGQTFSCKTSSSRCKPTDRFTTFSEMPQ